jgi:hypothetical protein
MAGITTDCLVLAGMKLVGELARFIGILETVSRGNYDLSFCVPHGFLDILVMQCRDLLGNDPDEECK